MLIDNVIYYDFNKKVPKTTSKESANKTEQTTKEQTQEPFSNNIIGYDKFLITLSKRRNREIDEIEAFLNQIGESASRSEINQALEYYYSDAFLARNALKSYETIRKEVQNMLQKADLRGLDNIKNFYQEGTLNEKDLLKADYEELSLEDFDFDDEEDDEKSKERKTKQEKSDLIMSRIAMEYIKALRQQFPEYTIETTKKITPEGKKIIEEINFTKNDYTVAFDLESFLMSFINKNIQDGCCIAIKSKRYKNLLYMIYPYSDIISLYDTNKNQEIQNIDIGCYQNNGDVDFDIDYFGDTGPIFCLRQLQEEKQESQEKIKQELQYIQSMDSETCESLKNILDNNLDAAMAAEKGFPLYLILNCIREGSFNLDVANAFEYIYSSLEEDDLPPLDSNYMNNLINLIEDADHTFRESLLILTSNLVKKEQEQEKNYHKLIYEILSTAHHDLSESKIDILIQITESDLLDFDEINKLFRILMCRLQGEKEKANKILDTLANSNKDKWNGKNNAISTYKRFLTLR